MFYHNHHRYKSGKRKGKAPIALLTDQAFQSDWVTLLLHQVAEHQVAFGASDPQEPRRAAPQSLCVSKTNTDVFGTGLRQAHGRFW